MVQIRGRIYRITPTGAKTAAWIKGLHLGEAGNDELIKQLANPNIWWRLNAQRLLVDKADKKVVSGLIEMAKNTSSPLGRLHALWTLEGIGELTQPVIEQAFKRILLQASGKMQLSWQNCTSPLPRG